MKKSSEPPPYPQFVDLPPPLPPSYKPEGDYVAAGDYAQFNDEDSDASSFNLETGDPAKNLQTRKWLEGQETGHASGTSSRVHHPHNIALPSTPYTPFPSDTWNDDGSPPPYRPAWVIAAEQHPDNAMKNSPRPVKLVSKRRSKANKARDYFNERVALFVGLAMIFLGCVIWGFAVSHNSPITRWVGCVFVVIGVGWLIVDCINVTTKGR